MLKSVLRADPAGKKFKTDRCQLYSLGVIHIGIATIISKLFNRFYILHRFSKYLFHLSWLNSVNKIYPSKPYRT